LAELGFEVGAYDASLPLVIDPTLVYSTYLGGSGFDYGSGIAVDSAGNAYVTGQTYSTDFPTANPFQAARVGGPDAFVAKLNAAGSALVYSTYLGGNGDDYGRGIAVDAAGNAYVTGETGSTNFPTANPLQASNAGGNYDAFVAKLNAAGSALVYSTYLGGSDYDYGYGIAVDAAGNAYVTGETFSTNFPTANPLQASNAGGPNAFVAKLNAAGSALVYCTYLGGSGGDSGQGIAVDAAGNAYVTGETGSNFPTANPFQASNAGGPDAFVARLNATGSALVYSTYLGGNGNDHGSAIAVDAAGNAYVTGETFSTNFPTANPLRASNAGGGDVFVAKLNAAGSALVYCTYLGGSSWDYGTGIAVDAAGNAYVTGLTGSTNFPTANPLQAANAGGNYDAFVAKLNAAGSALVYSTYLGGSDTDFGYGIAVDAAGNAYVTGETYSRNFPTANAFQNSNSYSDAFIAKLSSNLVPTLTSLSPSGAATGGPAFTLTANGTNFISGSVVRWNGSDRTTTYVSATQLTASIPASDIAAAGTAQVTVFNPAPDAGTSNALTFTIAAPNPVPTLTSLSPSSAATGGPAFTLTANGTNFVSGSAVRWNGSDRTTTYVSATQLTASIPASDIAAAGTAQVTVFNPAPGGGASNALAFTINNPVPALASLSPATATAGGAAFTLTVNGSNFVAASVVRWNGADRNTRFVSSTQVTASIAASDIATAGTAQLSVFNPPPGGGLAGPLSFSITSAIPTPAINPGGVANAASFVSGAVAPGTLASVFGTGLATLAFATGTPLPTTLGGATLTLECGGVSGSSSVSCLLYPAQAVPVIFASPTQINFQMPWGRPSWESPYQHVVLTIFVGGFSATIDLSGPGRATTPPGFALLPEFSPGIFSTNQSGRGQGAILISGSGGAIAAPTGMFPKSRPVRRGEFLEIYATGLGPVTNQPPTGAATASNPLPTTLSTPTVALLGVPAPVVFSGLAPGFVGLYQVNVQVPDNAPTGDAVPVVVTIGGATSNTVTIAVSAASGAQFTIQSLSATQVSPLSVLTIKGNGFAAGQDYFVKFTSAAGYSQTVRALANDANSLAVAVPPFIDEGSGKSVATQASVQVIDGAGRSSNTISGPAISAFPPLTLPAGSITLRFSRTRPDETPLVSSTGAWAVTDTVSATPPTSNGRSISSVPLTGSTNPLRTVFLKPVSSALTR